MTVGNVMPFVFSSEKLVEWNRHDWSRRYVTDAPNADRFVSLLRGVDDGDVGELVQLDEEMLSKDGHLQGVVNTRRAAVTALPWRVEPAEYPADQELADEQAAYCQERLDSIDTWPDSLKHFSTGVGPGIAVTELIWNKSELIETSDVPGHKLRGSPRSGPELYAVTEDPGELIELLPGKFVVYRPGSKSSFPFAVNLTRAQAWLYLIKHYVVADWAAFSEVAGMPVRVGIFRDGIDEADKIALANFIENMSSDAWALIPELADIKFAEAGKTQPYGDFVTWIEKKQSILYLGQTGTTELHERGSFAAARVHDNVRADLLFGDLEDERRAIRQQVLRPMVWLRFPHARQLPPPHFRRILQERRNLDAERVDMEQLRLAREFGLHIDEDVIYERLKIPKPRTEAPLKLGPVAG